MGPVDISVMISCFNEEGSIVPTIEFMVGALTRSELSWEIIVVDDASRDASAECVRQFLHARSELPIRLCTHETNRGLVYGIFEAVRAAHGQYFWVVAGDNNVDQETAVKLLSHIGIADIIIPYVLDYTGRSLHRRVISKAYAFLVRVLSGCPVRYYNGSSIHRRSHLIWLEDKINGFAISADCITRLFDHGCTFVEVPVVYRERLEGKSSALSARNFRDVAKFMLRLAMRRINKMTTPATLASQKGELG